MVELARKYDIDPEKLERLALHVNSATVYPDAVKRWVSEDGIENATMPVSILIYKMESASLFIRRLGFLGLSQDRGRKAHARNRPLIS